LKLKIKSGGKKMRSKKKMNVINTLESSKLSVLQEPDGSGPKWIMPGKRGKFELSAIIPDSHLILTVEDRAADSYWIKVPAWVELAPFSGNDSGITASQTNTSWELKLKEKGQGPGTLEGNATENNVTIGENEPTILPGK
jgi:hypothetical protein